MPNTVHLTHSPQLIPPHLITTLTQLAAANRSTSLTPPPLFLDVPICVWHLLTNRWGLKSLLAVLLNHQTRAVFDRGLLEALLSFLSGAILKREHQFRISFKQTNNANQPTGALIEYEAQLNCWKK